MKSAKAHLVTSPKQLYQNNASMKYNICSECFYDEGLKLTSEKIGINNSHICPNCNKSNGLKISKELLLEISLEFFVYGSYYHSEFGGSSLLMFNAYQKTDVDFGKYLKDDIKLIENTLGVGFFYYTPRLFKLGLIRQLENLQNSDSHQEILEEIIEKFPTKILTAKNHFYRLRKNISNPNDENQFDSPPLEYSGNGRLDSEDLNILYGSENIEICLHECRVSIIDELYLAKLIPTTNLKILDLSAKIKEDGTEFESLELSIHYIFRAEEHSYEICRKIAKFVFSQGYDGIIFPSYFSKIKTENIPNIALFNSPINEEKIKVSSIDRIKIDKIDYMYSFGPLLKTIKTEGNMLLAKDELNL